MKLTRQKMLDVAAEVSANRVEEFAKIAEKDGQELPVKMALIMTLTNVITSNSIADNLGLEVGGSEVEVSKDQFVEAHCKVLNDVCDKGGDLIRTMETMMFSNLLTKALYDNEEKEDETEKADS